MYNSLPGVSETQNLSELHASQHTTLNKPQGNCPAVDHNSGFGYFQGCAAAVSTKNSSQLLCKRAHNPTDVVSSDWLCM